MSLDYNPNIIPKAKELRKNMTPQEKHLWYDFLSEYSKTFRFQRQKTISNYIADFYCHEAKLFIELDGSQHFTDEGKTYDKERTEILRAYGLTVIRFTNYEIDRNFDGVCKSIDNFIKNYVENMQKS
ncbi:MAG: endonuclease domain-containing protein [Oscillospiraceae bacterium]|nr:endonuclease domain-containing protein [Oscillospiraceae bacterium]